MILKAYAMKKLLFSLCICVWLPACTVTNEDMLKTTRWQKEAMFNGGNPTLSFKEAKFRAQRGDANSQYQLAQMYEHGKEVGIDYRKAEYWYLKAAIQGNIYAQDRLGWIYQDPIGGLQKHIESTYWYRKAAEQGYAPAQNSLGFAYRFGTGIKQDYATSIFWYLKASEQNYAPAQRNLGITYEKGYGVQKDYLTAAEWYRKAAENGDGRAANYLGVLYRDGLGVKQDQQLALKWFKKAADKNDYEGKQNFISLNKLSFDQYLVLAKEENAQAQQHVCHMYVDGDEVEVDYGEAVKWCTKSAILGYVNAQEDLARMFFGGSIIEQDYQSAYIWAVVASAQDSKLKSLATSISEELTDQELLEAKHKFKSCLPPHSRYQDCPKPKISGE